MSSRTRDLLKFSAVAALAFSFGIAFASALDLPRSGAAQQSAAPPAAALLRPPDARAAPAGESFADIAERLTPTVVSIRSGRLARAPTRSRMPPGFDDFFRQFGMPSPFDGPEEPRWRQGTGSGFIVSADGYILTNNHVVADADQVRVKLTDNREFTARVVGRDPATDVAVIKIDANRLPVVTFGNSEQTRVGEWVLAIGNPLDFNFTVTAGIVSAKGRSLDLPTESRYSIRDFIQTDAAINPGNSGGPLVNTRGEVIGINSAIASQTGFFSGYGFAIPINLARRVMQDLIATGRVERAILGIAIRAITPEDAEYVGLDSIFGVVVDAFSVKSSPAERAGVQLGDVIVSLNGTRIDHVAQLQQLVGFRRPGDMVHVEVARRGTGRRTYDVRLIPAPSEGEQVARGEPDTSGEDASSTDNSLGVSVEPVSQEFARQARLSDVQQGLVVTRVEPGGPSWARLLSPSQGGPDIIVAVNQQRVRTLDELRRALRGVRPGQVVEVRIYNVRAGSFRLQRIRTRA